MNGLELSRSFFEEFGMPMLEELFPDLLPHLAAGLTGSGSECCGYDDDVSQDHDFGPGFCLFLPGEDVVDRRSAFLLERAYAKLPKEYKGFVRPALSPVGGNRHGVLRTEEFFLAKTGTTDGVLSLQKWLTVPEQSLLEATNGEIFFDNEGRVTRIRESLRYYPEDVRLKKLAGHLLLMGQAGQYNYTRCLRHNEPAAAQLAVCEFVKSTMSVLFLLNRRYQPYYKWTFRALSTLPQLSHLGEALSFLLMTDNGPGNREAKAQRIEEIASEISDYLTDRSLSNIPDNELEAHAYAVNDHVQDAVLRNMHVLAAV